MSEQSSLLEKLEGLLIRFEEIGTLITDPAVISDMKRYVKLTKEYKDLSAIMKVRKEYMRSLDDLAEAKAMLSEQDAEIRDMAREEISACEARIPQLEEEIKFLQSQLEEKNEMIASLENRLKQNDEK